MPKGLVGLTIRTPNEAWALETSLPPPGQELSLWGRQTTVSGVLEDL